MGVGTVSTVAAGPKKRSARTRRRGRGRGRGGRRRSRSRVVKRTADEVEAELAAAAGGSGVSVPAMVKEGGAAAGPDVETPCANHFLQRSGQILAVNKLTRALLSVVLGLS